jgi:hypothetical protein
VILSVHRQDRLPIAESNQEMAAFAGLEGAALAFQPSLELRARRG